MHLKRLEIHGFKSFAKNTALEFETGITAIVGPNGSGKSNVADAIRWVLGEQSAKLIRGKKSDDVIFAGSDKKLRQGFAEVVATFDNRDNKIPVDASEVSIGRRIDRSGDSEYLLNGNRVRLLDIVDIVLKSNIGTSRYTVIGQGTIDNMILAGPAEVKNLIDEASGVKTYYIKRERTLRRMEQTAQNLMRAEDLISELEPRLKSLRRQAKRMEARAEIEVELKTYQRGWLGAQYLRFREQLKAIKEKLDVVQEQKKALEQKLQESRHNVEAHEGSSQAELEKYKDVQIKLRKLQEKKNQLLENLSLVRGKMKSQAAAGGTDSASLQIAAREHDQKIAAIKKDLLEREEELARLESETAALRKQSVEIERKLNELYTALIQPAAADWKSVEIKLNELEKEFSDFYDRLRQASDLEQARAGAQTFKDSWDAFKNFARTAFRDPQSAPSTLRHELQDLLQQKDKLSGAAKSAEVGSASARMAREFLEQQLASLEQNRLHLELELKKSKSLTAADFLKTMTQEEDRIKTEIEALGKQSAAFEQSVEKFYQTEQQGRDRVAGEERQFRQIQDELNKVKDQESGILVEQATVRTQSEAVQTEIVQTLGPEALSDIETNGVSVDTAGLEEKITRLKRQLEVIGGVDELTLQEYQETEARFTNLSTQVADLKKSMQDLREIIDELDVHIKEKFNEAFHLVNEKFENYFRMLFNGGRAYLSVLRAENKKEQTADISADETDEAEDDKEQLRPEEKLVAKYEHSTLAITGIDMKATPPGKKLSSVQALSGGERALTSIALLCALLACFPSPFVVLDEVDAALDEANTIRFGQILATLAHQTQFITITHNRETMAQSNTLYGVTMGDDGISKLLSIKIEQAREYAK